jgi:hypothetical protein
VRTTRRWGDCIRAADLADALPPVPCLCLRMVDPLYESHISPPTSARPLPVVRLARAPLFEASRHRNLQCCSCRARGRRACRREVKSPPATAASLLAPGHLLPTCLHCQSHCKLVVREPVISSSGSISRSALVYPTASESLSSLASRTIWHISARSTTSYRGTFAAATRQSRHIAWCVSRDRLIASI